jgi:hypothetical protein
MPPSVLPKLGITDKTRIPRMGHFQLFVLHLALLQGLPPRGVGRHDAEKQPLRVRARGDSQGRPAAVAAVPDVPVAEHFFPAGRRHVGAGLICAPHEVREDDHDSDAPAFWLDAHVFHDRHDGGDIRRREG